WLTSDHVQCTSAAVDYQSPACFPFAVGRAGSPPVCGWRAGAPRHGGPDAMTLRDRATDYFRGLQDRIVAAPGALDRKRFHAGQWQRPGGGGGRTRVLVEGGLFEKAGVNFSDVHGEFSEEFAKQIPAGEGRTFTAAGVSLVLHPRSPMVPTVHANFR